MLEDTYLNLKICERINDESLRFKVEGHKFEIHILPVNNTFSLSIKQVNKSTSYSTKLNIMDFQKSQIFKNDQDTDSVRETIFNNILKYCAKIKFSKTKCFLFMSEPLKAFITKELNIQAKDTNFIIEFSEDLNLAVMMHNLTKRVDDLEKQNKLFKLENEKLKSDLIHVKNWKEKEVKELRELDEQKKEEISAAKSNLERINLVITSNKFLKDPYKDLPSQVAKAWALPRVVRTTPG